MITLNAWSQINIHINHYYERSKNKNEFQINSAQATRTYYSICLFISVNNTTLMPIAQNVSTV